MSFRSSFSHLDFVKKFFLDCCIASLVILSISFLIKNTLVNDFFFISLSIFAMLSLGVPSQLPFPFVVGSPGLQGVRTPLRSWNVSRKSWHESRCLELCPGEECILRESSFIQTDKPGLQNKPRVTRWKGCLSLLVVSPNPANQNQHPWSKLSQSLGYTCKLNPEELFPVPSLYRTRRNDVPLHSVHMTKYVGKGRVALLPTSPWMCHRTQHP